MTDARHIAESEARADLLAAFDRFCPGVVGNRFIPQWPLPAQAVCLGLHLKHPPDAGEAYECLYGGGAGGGKSSMLLMGAAQYVDDPAFAGVCIRRTYQQLIKADALLDRAMKWWLPAGAVWSGTDKKFTFPSGATVEMTYHGHPRDDANFQGAAYQYTAWDELTHWPDDSAYRWVSLSRMRRPEGSQIPLRALSASNPGSEGHNWVKSRFVGGHDLVTGKTIEAEHDYVPALVGDNIHLDRASYVKGLERLHPTVRQQLLNGDWGAREPGDYFRAEWFGNLLDPETDAWPICDKTTVRWWDLAASEKEGACHTAGVRMSRHRSGVRAIEHCRSFKATPGKRDDLIVQTARLDGQHVVVGIEIEPGSGGLAQFNALEKRLRAAGFRVAGARPKGMSDAEKQSMVRAASSDNAKAARCDPVASCLERGYQRRGESPDTNGEWWGLDLGRGHAGERDGIRLYVGDWTQSYLDIVEGFPGEGRMDEADATSGAWAYLEAHSTGLLVPMSLPSEVFGGRTEMLDRHPTDRPDPVELHRDRAGHWRP